MKTVLFLSQVTSQGFSGEGPVAVEMASPWNPQAAQGQRHSPSGPVLWLEPLGLGCWRVCINYRGWAAKENNSEAVTLGKAFASSRSFQTSALIYQRQLLK